MKIAYVAPYQGSGLLRERPPSEHSLSLAARVKIQLIAELLQKSSHQVEVISQGAVNINHFRYYPGFGESDLFHPGIPVYYTSALPIRFLRGIWEGTSALNFLKAQHSKSPYDIVIVYGLGSAQVRCAQYAIRHMGLPVILEYEDDVFLDVHGSPGTGLLQKKSSYFIFKHHARVFKKLFGAISGVMAPSPYLLSQIPDKVKKILVRGVVSDEILELARKRPPKNNWVVFSGTHERTQGLEQTVKAWRSLQIPGWELHIAGQGVFTSELERIAGGDRSIIFHGYLNREKNAELLCSAKIGMNAQDVTRIPGNVFAFKIVEYLAAGLHVVSTPRGTLESELEAGMTYIQDNSAETVAATLKTIINTGRYTRTAEQDAVQIYGPASVCESLNNLLTQVTSGSGIAFGLLGFKTTKLSQREKSTE